jgi:hypothetical protein
MYQDHMFLNGVNGFPKERLKLNLTANMGIQKSDEKHMKGEYSGAERLDLIVR